MKAGQGVLRVFVEGQTRARISSYTEVDGCVKVEVEELPDTGYPETPVEEEAFSECLKKERKNFPRKIRDFAPQLQKAIDERDLRSLVSELASQLPFELGKSSNF